MRRADVAMMFSKVTNGFQKRSYGIFLSLLLLPVLSLYYFQYFVAQHHKSERLLADLHDFVAEFPSNDVTVPDFASMASQVAVVAQLAELYGENHALNRSRLRESVVHLFPWWNEEKLAYIPWEHSQLEKTRTKQADSTETGIVVCVGDKNIEEALFLIRNLRNVLKSELPIEIAYAGDADLSPHTRTFLYATGKNIHFLDLTKVFNNTLLGMSGWATKPFALVASRFPRTILVDADVVFFSSPETAWHHYPGLEDTGVLFFRDRSVTMDHTERRRKFIADQLSNMGRQPSHHLNDSSLFYKGFIGEEADSAVVYFDKSRPQLYVAALFAAWMNIKDIRGEVTWEVFSGDKETYWMAAELIGVPYTFEPWQAARFSEYLDEPQAEQFQAGRLCSSHRVHSNANGSDPFWTDAGVWQNSEEKSFGFARWTHWFLGVPTHKAIETFASNLTLESISDSLELPKPENETEILATQASWHWQDWREDAHGCPQPDESRWKPLSSDVADVFQAIKKEARTIRYAWARKNKETIQ